MKSIFEYQDYREFLKDAYEKRKAENSAFSYQFFGSRIDLVASHISMMFDGERHLPVRCVPAVKKLFGLKGREATYFDLIFSMARTRSAKAKEELLEKAAKLRDVRLRQIQEKELEYFKDWWTVVIRSFTEVTRGRVNEKEIARSMLPEVSEEDVRRSLKLLLDLGFLNKASSGRVTLADPHLTICGAEKAQVIRKFQSKVMEMGAKSLEMVSPEERDVSTLTMAIDQGAFEDIREIVRECRRQIQLRISECESPDRVMQLNFAFFPVAKKIKENG